ncbi:MAG: hypothetical protein JXD19_08425 [Deltaproteobacteria bacterium]|nr:hypothetical protein [Deltaproteobacteria bacterium]
MAREEYGNGFAEPGRIKRTAIETHYGFPLRFGSQSGIILGMESCRHQELTLVKKPGKKLRCRRCHLTIDEKELGEGYCPECLEAFNQRSRDFEEVEPEDDGAVLYRCERCGALIKVK